MWHLRIVPDDTKFDFISRRKLTFAFSILLVAASLALFAVRGLNLGIDFLGGILVEVETEEGYTISDVRAATADLQLGEISIQEFGAPNDLLIRVQRQPGGDEAQAEAEGTLKGAIDHMVAEYRRTEIVGPTVGAELREAATYAVIAAILAILLYIWLRFEWQFGVCAVVALTHDVVSTMGLFSLLQLEFNLATVAAILTIAGYSINDTVVVFDRVREKIRKYKKMPLEELFNLAINKTLARTVMTSLTTLLALIALAVFGGSVIRDFAIALIWGVVIGTYSSILIAVPLLLYLRPHRGEELDESAGGGSGSGKEAPEAG